MRLIFICGSLEPGKDGVGDYTRRLCNELINQGIEVGILAYNDKFTKEIIENNQIVSGNRIPCYRLPNQLKGKQRFNLAKNWINIKNPEWLSLQFVPYSFNNKGLPLRLANQLKMLGGKRKWHFMFHELWIGISKESSKKDVVVGFFQEVIIKRLILALKPCVIHTQTQFYLETITSMGFKATIAPLFSNIPISNNSTPKKGDIFSRLTKSKFEIVLFGSIHPNTPLNKLIIDINKFCEELKFSKKVITFVGRSGYEKNNWKSIFKENNFLINDLGEESEENISKALHSADFGITTTPIYLVEKSGTVIAMRMHNLPIISVAKYWRPRKSLKINHPLDVLEFKGTNFKNVLNLKVSNSEKNKIEHTINQYLSFIN